MGEGNTLEVHEGDWLSIDGGTGEVFVGQLETEDPDFESEAELVTLLSWADKIRRLGVWANADYPQDAERARRYGARGHRPLPHRAHVLRRSLACPSCRA